MKIATGLHGSFIIPDDDMYVGRSLSSLGEYSEGEVDLYRALIQPDFRVIEIGANLGAHTVPLARLAGEVIAIEPQRAMYHALCGTLALNDLNNVETRRCAVGANNGSIRVPNLDTSKTHNFGAFPALGHSHGDKVPLVTLNDLPPAQFVKIDVEGAECDVIQGGSEYLRKYRPAFYIENDRAANSARLIRMIMAAGYSLYWHTPPMYRDDNHNGAENPWNQPIASFNMLCLPVEAKAEIGLRPVKPGETHQDIIRSGSQSRTPEAA
jgi:FkbM family methyltransferase